VTTARAISLDGQVAVVAGGAGAIGSAIAQTLAGAGASVFSLDLPGRPSVDGVTSVSCNLTDHDNVRAALTHIEEQTSRLDIVVHAAGVTRDARVWKLTDEDWRMVLSTNLDSAFFLVNSAVPALRRRGTGAIVLISSINGSRGKVGLSAYAASKAGLDALARTTARELGVFNIRVNAVAPGWIETPMTATVPAEYRQRAVDESALGRMGQAEDVANAVLYLTSDLGKHVTGQVLRVDGGQLIG